MKSMLIALLLVGSATLVGCHHGYAKPAAPSTYGPSGAPAGPSAPQAPAQPSSGSACGGGGKACGK